MLAETLLAALSRLPAPSASAALAFAEAIVPPGERAPGADERLLRRIDELLAAVPAARPIVGWVQVALDWLAVPWTGRRFSRLGRAEQQRLLAAWQRNPVLSNPVAFFMVLYKMLHYDQDHVFTALGGERPVSAPETERWMSQITRADEWAGETTIECDVVVVGTGAGGAVVGRELADRGHAVVFVEEGEFYRRHQLGLGSIRSLELMRGKPMALAVGNLAIPVFMGRGVGGSTLVNTATCWRTPPRVLERWCEVLGDDDFSAESMAPRFARVEAELQVTAVTDAVAGPIRDILTRGCERLGWSHTPVRRNAPDCQGEGFCQFGCATGSRRSTERTYLPKALGRGAVLLTGLRADEVLIESGRAVGLRAVSVAQGRELTVRARAVILSGGAVATPSLLTRQGLCQTSGQLGRNLTLHPSAGVSGIFDEPTRPHLSVPQGHACDEFMDQGIMIIGAQPSYDMAGGVAPVVGDDLVDLMDSVEHLVTLGVLAEDDDASGRVLLDRNGHVLLRYDLTPQTLATLDRGIVKACELLLAAGATRVYPGTQPVEMIHDAEELRAYARQTRKPGQMLLIAYHPLGTCRMGTDPRTSVVGTDHQAHDLPGLFVVDGSAVPTPLGVNPQITIMGLATRAAERIDQALG